MARVHSMMRCLTNILVGTCSALVPSIDILIGSYSAQVPWQTGVDILSWYLFCPGAMENWGRYP